MINFSKLNEFIGQEKIKEDLKIHINNAREEREPLDHVMLYGSAGLGKTTLAKAITEALDEKIFVKTGDEIRKDSLWPLLKSINENNVLFIDEIHNMPVRVAEILYGPLQEINNMKLKRDCTPFIFEGEILCPFTLIGGTTAPGMLSKPLRDRIVLDYHLKPYAVGELVTILVNQGCPEDAATVIAERSRGIPRLALNRFFIRARNRAMGNILTQEICLEMFESYGIDSEGFTEDDLEILRYIDERKVASESAIFKTLDIDPSDYKNMYEPFLLQKRLIRITSKGRELTENGKRKIA